MKIVPSGIKKVVIEFDRVSLSFFPFFKTVCIMNTWTGESATISWDRLEDIIKRRLSHVQLPM